MSCMDHFEYKIDLDQDRKVVIVTVQGKISNKSGKEVITNARSSAEEYGYNILYDLRETELSISVADLFHLARNPEVLGNPKMKYVTRVAILSVPDDQNSNYNFYETTAHNAGLRVKVFMDEEEAYEWLR